MTVLSPDERRRLASLLSAMLARVGAGAEISRPRA